MKNIFAISVISCILLSSCVTEYEYTAPTTAEGMSCISLCQTKESKCKEKNLNIANEELKQCETKSARDYETCNNNIERSYNICLKEAENEYLSCLKYSYDRNTCYKQDCRQPSCSMNNCSLNVSYKTCESDFRECYQQCGGKVDVKK